MSGTTATTPAKDWGEIRGSPMLYWIPMIALFLIFALGGLVLAIQGPQPELFGEKINLGYILWEFGILYLFVTAYRTVDIEHVLGVYFLYMPAFFFSGGPIFLPWGLFQGVPHDLEVFEDELPAEPEMIWRDVGPPPKDSGMKPPIRINFCDPHSHGYPFGVTAVGIRDDDPTYRKITEEVTPFVRWRIQDVFRFRRNIGNRDKARAQLEDMSVSFLSEFLTRMPLAVAVLNQQKINEEYETLLRAKTARWGIEIVDAKLKGFAFSKSLNTAIENQAQSVSIKRTTITNAEAEESKLEHEGKGRAKARQSELDAETEALKKRGVELGIHGADALAAEVARDFGKGDSDKVILGAAGLAESLGIGAAIKSMFSGGKSP